MSIERITDTSLDVIDPLARTVGLAFRCPFMEKLNGGLDNELHDARMRNFVMISTLDYETYVARMPGSDNADCVMLLKPPGLEYGKTPGMDGPCALRVKELTAGRPDLERTVADIRKAFHEVEVAAWGPNTVTDKYYISHLATAPWAAGHGLGGKMLEMVLQRGKKEGVEVTLLTMTERHVEYYKRYGFKVKADLEADLDGLATHWWAMGTAD